MNALLAENPRAVIGGNQPPEPTPYEAAEKEISDLYEEARMWLDGAEVSSQELADGIGNLLSMIRAAEKKADAARAAEKKPHDDAGKAVQARYRPLLDRAQLVQDACKKALAPWLARLEKEKREAAEKARAEAEQRQWLAEQALQAERNSLDEQAHAEARVKAAKEAVRDAKRAENAPAVAGGTVGRAVGLRTVHYAVMTDAVVAARHYWQTHPDEMKANLQAIADREVRQGKRDIPGFEIRTEKVAV
jgi:hypothetical protein